MKKKNYQDDLNNVAAVYKSLGHPARLEILKIILENKLCTCGEIVKKMPLAQSTISKHLLELKKAKLISETFVGKKTIISLNSEGFILSSDYLTNFILNCKYANAFNAQKSKKSSVSNANKRKANLNLKVHNYVFSKKKKNID